MISNVCSIAVIVSTLAVAGLLGGCVGATPGRPTETPAQATTEQSHSVLADGFAVRNEVDCKPACYR